MVCKEPYGGYLVEVNSAEENSFLVSEGRRHGRKLLHYNSTSAYSYSAQFD